MAVPELRFRREDGTEYPEWGSKKLQEIFCERNVLMKISQDAPLLSFTIEQGIIDPSEKKTNKRDFLMKDKDNKKFLLTEFNDIIYNPANIRFGAIHRNKLGRGVVSPIYAIFSTTEEPAFMEYIVRNPAFITKTLRYLEGSVIKLMTLKPKDFLQMDVRIPCLEEQQKIASFLSDLDTVISASEAEMAALEQQKKGVMQKIFSQEVRFRREDGTEYPEWEEVCFDLVMTALPNNTFSREELCYSGTGVRNIHYGDVLIKYGSLVNVASTEVPCVADDSKLRKLSEAMLQNGDIVIADTAEDDTVGKAVEVSGCEGITAVSGLHTMPYRPVAGHFSPGFLGYFINSPAYHDQLRPLMQGIKVTSVSRKAVQNETFLFLPCLEEQQKIASLLSDMDAAIDLAKRELAQWKLLKKGLMQRMFV